MYNLKSQTLKFLQPGKTLNFILKSGVRETVSFVFKARIALDEEEVFWIFKFHLEYEA